MRDQWQELFELCGKHRNITILEVDRAIEDMFMNADADGNGEVDLDNLDNFLEKRSHKSCGLAMQTIKILDFDKDGWSDVEELKEFLHKGGR